MEQAAERPFRAVRPGAMVGVDVLPDQRDFAHAGRGQAFDLGEDLRDRARHLGAARVGHYAEAAEAVAALLYRNEGGYAARARRVAARGREKIEFVLDRKFGIDHPPLARDPVNERGQAMIALRS